MVCLGTAYAGDRTGFRGARKLHKKIRNLIFEVRARQVVHERGMRAGKLTERPAKIVEDSPRVEICHLQSILLVNYFGRMFSTAMQHDVAQVRGAERMPRAACSHVFCSAARARPGIPLFDHHHGAIHRRLPAGSSAEAAVDADRVGVGRMGRGRGEEEVGVVCLSV
jgi:hypothetical protein